MSGFPGNRASNASERPERREAAMTLATARRMLPLVQRILEDIRTDQTLLARLEPEQDRLDRHRRDLSWPERQRRYQVRDEITTLQRRLSEATAELQSLGTTLLDAETGRVGFPTIVNDRRAYFSWRLGEETIRSWHFAEESICRPIPPSWLKVSDISLTGKS
ncbi:MAG: DUF2203 domain-containing protein [Gemmataceae bacterium]|nr:DUF2203 domain-containing protein [Gemmataceae bacterium]